MRKAGLVSAIAAMLLAGLVINVGAPRAQMGDSAESELFFESYGVDVGVSIGLAVPTLDQISSAMAFDIEADYSITDYLSVGLSLGRFSSDVENSWDAATEDPPHRLLSDGDISVTPLVFSAQYRYTSPELLGTLYGFAGVGYYFIDYSWNTKSETYFTNSDNAYNVLNARQDVSNSFGFNLGAGFDYPITARLVFNCELQHIFLKPEIDVLWKENASLVCWHTDNGEPQCGGESNIPSEYDLNTWLASVGLKVLF